MVRQAHHEREMPLTLSLSKGHPERRRRVALSLSKGEKRLSIAWAAVTLALVSSPGPALACAVCYGAAEGPFIRGLQLSVIALLGVTYFVIGGLLATFLVLKRRARIPAPVSNEGAC